MLGCMQSATQADKEASPPESDALRKRKAWKEAHVMPAQVVASGAGNCVQRSCKECFLDLHYKSS